MGCQNPTQVGPSLNVIVFQDNVHLLGFLNLSTLLKDEYFKTCTEEMTWYESEHRLSLYNPEETLL